MPMNPAHRLIQLALNSLGFDPGPIDSWWGVRTALAARALATDGPVRTSPWAVRTLQRGMADLGHYSGPLSTDWDVPTRAALGRLLDADGAHAAALVTHPEVLDPVKPPLARVTGGGIMRQGSAGTVVETFCLHCAAVGGDWARDKSNAEIAAAIHRMHTLPKSQGGRGWSDTGYHAIACPDGEILAARPEDRYGAGAIGWNRGVYHLLMIEVCTITTTRHPEDCFTPETLAAARARIESIARRTPLKRLMGHREVAAKLCPGFEVIDRDWTDRAVA